MKIFFVKLTKDATDDLSTVPFYIKSKLFLWAEEVKKWGIHEVRKIRGYHDEPLKGNRKGMRSIRLNKAYRAIYKEDIHKEIHIIWIKEVNKHEY